jgi:AraC family transcriptional regulator
MQRLTALKPRTANDYRARLGRVLQHLTLHLDADHRVGDLARIAHFSPFHFHRIFRGVTGESVAGLVRRLRLERAALALRRSDASVIAVALDAGYGSPEAFARAFQQGFGLTPSDFRRALSPGAYAPPLSLPLRLDPESLAVTLEPLTGGTAMDVHIEEIPARLAACVRHVGPYEEVGPSYDRIVGWARANNLLGPGAIGIGLSYDDPESVPREKLRYDACLTLPEPLPAGIAVPDGIRIERIAGGRYAVHLLKGPCRLISETFRRIFGLWLPQSGEEVGDRPCMEVYLKSPALVPEAEMETKICVPLRG